MRKLRIVSFILVIALAVGLFAGCGKKSKYSDKQVVWLVVGTEAADTPRILKEFNKQLKEKTGYEVIFKYIDSSQYDLQFSSDEEFDLVIAPDHMGYWTNVEKGAFMEITQADFEKHAPYIWEHGRSFIETGKFEGKYYCIPGINEYSPDRVLLARGDLMDKYGIETLNNYAEIDEYLMKMAADEELEGALIPFNAQGNQPWMIFNLFASEWGWGAVGTLSMAEHIYYDTDEKYQTMFKAIDTPEVKEFSEIVKKWYDNGVFSKSILSNETSAEESFKVGKSGFAWTSSPSSANVVYKDLQKDERTKNYDVRFYSLYSRQQRMYNYMNCAVAVSAKSKKKAQALEVLDAIYADEKLYNLLLNGEEGVHYRVTDDGFEPIETKKEYMAPGLGIKNEAYDFQTKFVYDYADELVEELANKTIYDPLVNCPIMTSDEITIIESKLDEVYANYTTSRTYGVVPDVDKAIADEKAALEAAGLDAYITHAQKQVDQYIKDNPEFNERYKESVAAVRAYNKKHPGKTNPKDFK